MALIVTLEGFGPSVRRRAKFTGAEPEILICAFAFIARAVYGRRIGRLTAGNVTNAVKAINITARDNFAQLFTSYGAALPQIAASASVIKQGTVSMELAEYILLRTEGTTRYAHSLYLMRGTDGFWRIDSM